MNIEREITEHYAQKDRSEVAVGQDHLHIGGNLGTFPVAKSDSQRDVAGTRQRIGD